MPTSRLKIGCPAGKCAAEVESTGQVKLDEMKVETQVLAYSEVAGKEHWWWDTTKSNDGGVMFDSVVRRFMHTQVQLDMSDDSGATLPAE